MARKMTMDAVTLLKDDHRRVEKLFESYEKARDSGRKSTLAQQICMELAIHTTIEEEIFYPACKGQIEDEERLEESYVEHDGTKVLVAELSHGEPDNEFFDATVKVLAEMVKHHVREEEKRSEGLFAMAKQAGLDFDELGRRMMERKEELKEELGDGARLPPPHTRSFTGHELVQDRPVEAREAAE